MDSKRLLFPTLVLTLASPSLGCVTSADVDEITDVSGGSTTASGDASTSSTSSSPTGASTGEQPGSSSGTSNAPSDTTGDDASTGGGAASQCDAWAPAGEACEGMDANSAIFEVRDSSGASSTVSGQDTCMRTTISYPAGALAEMRFACSNWGEIVVAVSGTPPPLGDHSVLTISREITPADESVVITTDGDVYFAAVRASSNEALAGGFSFVGEDESGCEAIPAACEEGQTALFQRVAAVVSFEDRTTTVFSGEAGFLSPYRVRVARVVSPACVPSECTLSDDPEALEAFVFRTSV